MALVLELEPDERDVAFAVEFLGLELMAPGLEDFVAAETVWRIAARVELLPAGERRGALDGLLRPAMAQAVVACREAGHAARASSEAAREVLQALAEGGRWMEPLEKRSDGLLREAAERLIVAHVRCREARGVDSAVQTARQGGATGEPREAGRSGGS